MKLSISLGYSVVFPVSVSENFMKDMIIDLGTKIFNIYKVNIPIIKLTNEEESQFKNISAYYFDCYLKSFKNII